MHLRYSCAGRRKYFNCEMVRNEKSTVPFCSYLYVGHIKGENLLVDSSGNVAKLPDFGLANIWVAELSCLTYLRFY